MEGEEDRRTVPESWVLDDEAVVKEVEAPPKAENLNFMVFSQAEEEHRYNKPTIPRKETKKTNGRITTVHDLNLHNVDDIHYKIFEAEQSGNIQLARELKEVRTRSIRFLLNLIFTATQSKKRREWEITNH